MPEDDDRACTQSCGLLALDLLKVNPKGLHQLESGSERLTLDAPSWPLATSAPS
jgi:hypothetical protein